MNKKRPSAGPLQGIKVLDFGQSLLAPVAARLLADLGADVIKIEPLEGDNARLTLLRQGDSAPFLVSNRGKRSIAVNLRDERGRQIVLKLAKRTDVIIQNFRPQVMEKLGLDYPTISKINPRIIYCSASMYGETGPLAHRRGADPWGQALTGVVRLQGSPEGPPYLSSVAFLDYGGAALSAFAIVSALYVRERTGVGQEVTTNQVNTGTFLQEAEIGSYLIDGRLFEKVGRGGRGLFPYGAYPAKDGDVVTIFGQDDDEWTTVCAMLGIEYLLGDPRYDTAEKRTNRKFELYPILDEAFRKKTKEEWQETFRKHSLRCDPCLNYAEFVAHPQFQCNEMTVEVTHPRDGKMTMPGVPVKFKGTPARGALRHPPVLGEHSKEVLSELGYSNEEIEDLSKEGVIGVPTPDMLKPMPRNRAPILSAPTGRSFSRKLAKSKKSSSPGMDERSQR